MTLNNAVGRHSCLSRSFFVQEKKWQEIFHAPFIFREFKCEVQHIAFLSFTPGFSQVATAPNGSANRLNGFAIDYPS